MLERGAEFKFSSKDNEQIPPEIENDFLNYIAEFEKQAAAQKLVKIFDKIQKPNFFKPVASIPEAEIGEAWKILSEYLMKYGIGLDVCSPNISARELYRFTTEELFQYEMADMDLPGMTTTFIYDEFHPDPVYDNTNLVDDDLFGDIFCKRSLFYQLHYAKSGFSFNGESFKDWQDYNKRIDSFKSQFDEIQLAACNVQRCFEQDSKYLVQGNYEALGKREAFDVIYKGDFEVELEKGPSGHWEFKTITIEGFTLD